MAYGILPKVYSSACNKLTGVNKQAGKPSEGKNQINEEKCLGTI